MLFVFLEYPHKGIPSQDGEFFSYYINAFHIYKIQQHTLKPYSYTVFCFKLVSITGKMLAE